MSRLYNRRIEVVAGSVKLQEHEVQFDATSTLTSDPDEAVVRVYNLTENDRSKLSALPRNTQLEIKAGYVDPGPGGIYTGNIRRVFTVREAQDIVTQIESSSSFDARSPLRRVDKSYRKGSSLRTVIQDLIAATGARAGNSGILFNLPEFVERFDAPYHASGPAWDQLVQIVESRGYRISTKGSRIYVTGIKKAENLRSVALLSEKTGLIGTPSYDNDGILTCETLMLQGIIPGVLVKVRSEFINGTYKVLNTIHAGSLYGATFGIRIEGEPI